MIELLTIEMGDSVRLNKLNGVYTTFTAGFKKLGFKDKTRNPQNVLHLKELKGDFFKVFAIGKKDFSELVGIENKDSTIQLLVERRAVTVVRKRRIFLDNDTL